MQRFQQNLLADAIAGQPIEQILGRFNPGSGKVEQKVANDDSCGVGGTAGCHTDDKQGALPTIRLVRRRRLNGLHRDTNEAAGSTGRENLAR